LAKCSNNPYHFFLIVVVAGSDRSSEGVINRCPAFLKNRIGFEVLFDLAEVHTIQRGLPSDIPNNHVGETRKALQKARTS